MRTINALGLHWTPVILRYLASKDSETFSRLLEQTRATPRMLTRTLRHLVGAKLVDHDEFFGSYAINTKGGKALLILGDADGLDGGAVAPDAGPAGTVYAGHPPKRELQLGERVYTNEGDQRRKDEP